MIEYVEIRDANSREVIGIVDTATSVIWHSVYYGVGDFEIYAPCTPENTSFLVVGNFVTRYNDRNVGIIEQVQVTYNDTEGRMIAAIGRFGKSVLDRRLIYKRSGYSVSPTILRGNVEDSVRQLVSDNAISCSFDSGRNIPELALGEDAGIAKTIIDENGSSSEKQVTYKELLSYTDELLEEYGMSAFCGLDGSGKLSYTVFEGVNRSVDNVDGNEPVIFSQDFDNLLTSSYAYDVVALKNTALIGGAGEGTERFCSILKEAGVMGLARREMFVDASSSSKTYTDESDIEHTLTDSEYDLQLKSLGRQSLTKTDIVETFEGEIDLTNGSFKYGDVADFYLGDIVTVQDIEIGMYANVRILEITEVQDHEGYKINAVYGK